VTLTIQRTCGAGCAYNGNIVVRYATLDGTAVTGTDYVAKTGSVTLNSTTASANITITITNDALVEAPETFGVQLGLTSPLDGRAVLGTNTLATVTIISNE